MFCVPELYRVNTGVYASSLKHHGNNGHFKIMRSSFEFPKESKNIAGLFTQASDGEGWEHVSVSVIAKVGKKRRLPTHAEMEFIRFLFWDSGDWVIEFHPPVEEYVNNAPCLHLWRPVDTDFPKPPNYLIGIK